MKKFRIGCMLMLITAMAVVFTACGGDDSENNNELSTENVSQNNNDMNNAGDRDVNNTTGTNNDMNGDNVGNGIGDAIEDVGDGVGDAVKDVGDGVKDIGDGVGEGVDNITDDGTNNTNGTNTDDRAR